MSAAAGRPPGRRPFRDYNTTRDRLWRDVEQHNQDAAAARARGDQETAGHHKEQADEKARRARSMRHAK